MTQLDLPQISLSRYVDLLKRRRWQVIPMSLIGLLIGGVVAFFIPRYYVASAAIAYQQPPGESRVSREDPFSDIIDSAKLTLPLAIEPTIKELGWPEGLVSDPFELSENIGAIQERLEILEYGNSKDRSYALIRVTYKDRDGNRAAGFLNKLVGTWIGQEQAKLMERARLKLVGANSEHKQHFDAYNTFLLERQHLQQTYRIEPGVELAVQRRKHGDLVDAHTANLAELGKRKLEIVELKARIDHEKQRLRDMPARVPIDLELMQIEAAKSEAGLAIIAQIALDKAALENYRPGQPQRIKYERSIAYYTAKLTELVKPPEADADGLIPNPVREQQRELIVKLEGALVVAEATVGPLEEQLAKEEQRLIDQAKGYVLYERAEQQLAEAETNAATAAAKVQAATDIVGRLTNDPTVRLEARANPPPAPTEPNLLLVALLGCVIGLLAATALVLLLDVLQGSFKTVEDVESSLSVPVLGGVSHLETDAQRRQAVRSRRRATIVAAAFLTLVGGVVLLYYFDPTRLPPIVRDMLAMVLGTA